MPLEINSTLIECDKEGLWLDALCQHKSCDVKYDESALATG